MVPASETSASNDGQDASGLLPDAKNLVKTKHMTRHKLVRQDLRQLFQLKQT